jgi:hypothetical protein
MLDIGELEKAAKCGCRFGEYILWAFARFDHDLDHTIHYRFVESENKLWSIKFGINIWTSEDEFDPDLGEGDITISGSNEGKILAISGICPATMITFAQADYVQVIPLPRLCQTDR